MMNLILLALIVSITAYPDYYAVQIENGYYKIFTKRSECRGAVYQSGVRVLFHDRVGKIGTLKNYLDCNSLNSVVEEEYWTNKVKLPRDNTWTQWIDIQKTYKYGYNVEIWIRMKGFKKSIEVTNLNLVGGIKADAKTMEDCLRMSWMREYRDKHIVVGFKNSNCFYAFVDQAELAYDYGAIIFVHPPGKN